MKSVTTAGARRAAGLGLALLLCAGGASAQMYKWVDASGKTHFTDQPPPPSARTAQIRAGGGAAGGVQLPYALAQATRNYPVTLFTSSPCGVCDQGRTFLKARGIPFSEKTVSSAADEEKLRQAGGSDSLPFLLVGSAKATGFQSSTWDMMLNVALYPATKILPASYQYPAAVSAAPKPPKAQEPDPDAARLAAAAEELEKRRKAAAAPKPPTAPPGFQF